jgi:hypothetical protein
MKKKLVLVGLIIILLLVSGFLGHTYWLSARPEYALWQIGRAMKKRDLKLFRKYVELDSIVEQAVDDVVRFAAAQAAAEQLSPPASVAAREEVLSITRDGLIRTLRDQIKEYVRSSKVEQTPALPFEETAGSKLLAVILPLQSRLGRLYQDFEHVKIKGKSASIGVMIFDQEVGEEFLVELKLQRKRGDYWQLVAISNGFELLQRIDKYRKIELGAFKRAAGAGIN